MMMKLRAQTTLTPFRGVTAIAAISAGITRAAVA